MNLFDLVARILLNTDDFDNGLDRALGAAQKFGGALKSGLATAAKVGAAALGTATAAVGALTKASIDGYAEYEQLVGGVETLFKDSAGTVQEYAANAYKTAGVSANAYMEQATAFSASLIQSLGGDTRAAAEYANQAITDMSDNANKMGTDIGSIQNTYQSLMRGNYAMLDNLKLGYGGTKEELERLVADAEKLTGQALDPTKFSDIITAIHAVQTEMGITGTTAKEAGSTIEGSIASMKAAWSNLVTGIGNENANLDELIGNFVDSFATAAENVIPRIEKILEGIGSVIEKLAPIISEKLPALVARVLPSLLSAGGQLVGGLFNGIMAALPALAKTASSMISTLTEGLSSAAPQAAEFAVKLVTMLVEAILDIFKDLPEIIKAGAQAIASFARGVADALPGLIDDFADIVAEIVEALTDPETISALVEAGFQLIVALVSGLVGALPKLLEAAPEIVENLVEAIIRSAPLIVGASLELIVALGKALIDCIPILISYAVEIPIAIIRAIKDGIAALIGQIPQEIIDGIKQAGAWLIDQITGFFSGIGNMIVDIMSDGILGAIPKLLSYVAKIPEAIINGIKDGLTGIVDIAPKIIEGLVDGIKQAGARLKEQITGFFSGIVNDVKNLLGIHSPSRVFAGIGENMALGIGAGWDNEFSAIKDKIKNGMEFGTASVDFESSGLAASNRSMASNLLSGMQESGSAANIPINLTLELDGEVLARKLFRYNRAENAINGYSLVEGVSM